MIIWADTCTVTALQSFANNSFKHLGTVIKNDFKSSVNTIPENLSLENNSKNKIIIYTNTLMAISCNRVMDQNDHY